MSTKVKICLSDKQLIIFLINTQTEVKVNNFIRKIGLTHLTVQYKTIHLLKTNRIHRGLFKNRRVSMKHENRNQTTSRTIRLNSTWNMLRDLKGEIHPAPDYNSHNAFLHERVMLRHYFFCGAKKTLKTTNPKHTLGLFSVQQTFVTWRTGSERLWVRLQIQDGIGAERHRRDSNWCKDKFLNDQ